MRTLTYEQDINGFSQPTAKVTLRGGKEMWVCNPFDQLTEAIESGEPFTGHEVRALKASPAIINPAHVATVTVP